MSIYLIKFGSSSRKITLLEKTREALFEAARNAIPGIQDDSNVQMWDDDFSDYVDVEDFSSMPDKTKLLFIPSLQPATPVLPQQAPVVVNEGNPVEQEVENANNEHKPFPVVYRLPVFPASVRAALSTNPSSVLTNFTQRKQILDCLFEDLVQYDNGYPSSRIYNVVLRTLIEKYPDLSDKRLRANQGRCNCSPYATWLESLRNRFKYRRGKLIGNAEVDAMRQKYSRTGPKRAKASEPSADNSDGVYERHEYRDLLKLPANSAVGEDDASISAHIEVLKKEWNKPNPDFTVLEDRLRRTSKHRLELYDGDVETLLERYSLMTDSYQLIADNKLFHGLDFTSARNKWMSAGRVDFLLKKIGRKSRAKQFTVPGMECSTDLKQRAVLGLLPILFKEPMGWWMLINKDVHHKAPVIQVKCDDEKKFYEEGASLNIFLDKKLICGNAPTLELGLDTLFSVVYLFNAEFPSSLKNTCRFLSEVVFNVPCKKPLSNCIQALVNNISALEKNEAICECGGDECNCT